MASQKREALGTNVMPSNYKILLDTNMKTLQVQGEGDHNRQDKQRNKRDNPQLQIHKDDLRISGLGRRIISRKGLVRQETRTHDPHHTEEGLRPGKARDRVPGGEPVQHARLLQEQIPAQRQGGLDTHHAVRGRQRPRRLPMLRRARA